MPLKKSFRQLVDDAKTRVQNLSLDELKQEVAQGEVLLVDIRDIRERWQLGQIPGSFHAARGMLEAWADPESPYYRDVFQPERRIVLY